MRWPRLLSRTGGVARGYPMDRSNDRSFQEGFDGTVYYWDIDKTYLVSEFQSLRGLLTMPFELAIDKRNVAGTDTLLKALRRGAGPVSAQSPLYFVSASPPQLRRVIARKMLYDGVEFDGLTFKDHLANFRARRFGRLKDQIGYKLSALLRYRQEIPWTVSEVLFGDDSEQDALAYALYADITAGRLRGAALQATLERHGVDAEDAASVVELATEAPEVDLVRTIYINLEARTPPVRFAAFGPQVVPCYDTLQMALHLEAQGRLEARAVAEVARDLRDRHGKNALALVRSALDLVERGILALDRLLPVWETLRTEGLVPHYLDLGRAKAPHGERTAPQSGGFVTPVELLALGPRA